MSTIINSGVFDDGFFSKKSSHSHSSSHSCDCGGCNTCDSKKTKGCTPTSTTAPCFCNFLKCIESIGATGTVLTNAQAIYTGTISEVNCDYFTIVTNNGTFRVPFTGVSSVQ
ncbi:hypothetical protein IC620_05520 [Hazenella sp. IB182357]|uniref:Uncharacterized protein n=1 Tax=Polycladospora coralii TaxID=2771432 RepID=A0A926N9F0_9BACL|nr:hypothetical protein [Polycladospora coralii]MBD1371817.1 hypothetical protein [Polycladospora coralii]MBS7529278.1 hypothetical protein [Polycladospora coralii]